MTRRHLLLAGSGLLIIGTLLLWQRPPLDQAPAIRFKTITNRVIDLKQLSGRTVLLNFWATDCPSCLHEIPFLIELHKRYHSSGLEIIGISMYYDIPSHVVTIRRELTIPYPLALDLKGEISQAFGRVQLTPTSVIISPQGTIVFRKTGLFDTDALEKRIVKLLANASPDAENSV